MKLAVIAVTLLSVSASPAFASGPELETTAPIAFLVDLSSGSVLYAKDADKKMPPASMAKMMTSHVAFEMIKKGTLKLDQTFPVRPETWRKWHGSAAGSTMFLSPNERVSVENLLHGIITLSCNDACVVLAEGIAGSESVFVGRMNAEAKRLGMTNSRFGTSNGWPDGGQTLVTARDLATLAVDTVRNYPDLYRKFYQQKQFSWGKTMGKGDTIVQANRNPILGRVEGADGLKTGHTKEAGYGFTGSAEQNGRRLVMVVAGLESYEARISESVKILNWGFKAWAVKPLFAKGAQIGVAKVSGGFPTRLALQAPQIINLTYPAGQKIPFYKTRIQYRAQLEAPIRAGQPVADLIITSAHLPPAKLPLVAGHDVVAAGVSKRIWLHLMSVFGK
jgi:D-alanyl-D-alanine carboxypeptidase (penicillin-binding protein 5/6)